jgi:hypothetical protein
VLEYEMTPLHFIYKEKKAIKGPVKFLACVNVWGIPIVVFMIYSLYVERGFIAKGGRNQGF